MGSTPEVKVSRMDAGTKKTWKVHQLAEELYKWSAYLQQSAERFEEELTALNAKTLFVTSQETKLYKDLVAGLATLKKEGAQLKVRAHRLHGPRR
jgi:hypothetical protein